MLFSSDHIGLQELATPGWFLRAQSPLNGVWHHGDVRSPAASCTTLTTASYRGLVYEYGRAWSNSNLTSVFPLNPPVGMLYFPSSNEGAWHYRNTP